MNELTRCVCKTDKGSTESIDRINFTKPTFVVRCDGCNGLIQGDELW